MSTLATTNIKHESASTPNITLTSGGATTVNGTLNLGSSPLATPTGSAPSYTCRAWVNFNGTGTVAIRASGNVSSITDNGTGDYTVNFATALADANYAANSTAQNDVLLVRTQDTVTPRTTTILRVACINTAFAAQDSAQVSVSILR
jgi:hypothetical protein